jgi:hypothetical protein
MASTVANSTIKMSVLTTISSISSSIYETSLETFINDTEAYTTVDIN